MASGLIGGGRGSGIWIVVCSALAHGIFMMSPRWLRRIPVTPKRMPRAAPHSPIQAWTRRSDPEPGARAPAGLLRDLQRHRVEGDDVVRAHRALGVLAQDGGEVDAVQGHERARRIGGLVGELVVVVGDEPLRQVGMGRRARADAREVQFVDEAALDGAIEALPAAAGLGGVGADVLDAQVREGPAHLGEVRPIDGAAGRRGVKGPAGAIGVEGDGQAPRRADGMQGREDRRGRLGRPELGVEQALGGVVEDRDERLAFVGTAAQPSMGAAVEVQQLAETRAGLAPPAVPTAGAALAYQAGLRQGQLDEAIGEPYRVVAPRRAIEVADVPAGEPLPVQAQDPLDLERRRRAPRGPLAPPIIPGHRAAGLEPGPPAPHAARLEAEDLGGGQPADRPTQGLHDDLLHLHGPLHSGRGIEHGHPPGPWL
jgi:hypothetical protein